MIYWEKKLLIVLLLIHIVYGLDEDGLYKCGNGDRLVIDDYESAINQRYIGYIGNLTNYETIFIDGSGYFFNRTNLVDLFFASNAYSNKDALIKNHILTNLNSNQLVKCLIMNNNDIDEKFLTNGLISVNSKVYSYIVQDYFTRIRSLDFSNNKFKHLNRNIFEIFKNGQVESVNFASNVITSVQHDTFYDLVHLKYVDLSLNQLRLIHPMTFPAGLDVINLSNNHLKALYPIEVKKLIISGGLNDISCDNGLVWLYRLKNKIDIDENFICRAGNGKGVLFTEIPDESFLVGASSSPSLYVNTTIFAKTSEISLFRSYSKRWFAWTVFVDHLPVTTPYPYLISNQTDASVQDQLNENVYEQEKHVFHVWRSEDAIFECSNHKSIIDDSNATNDDDPSKSTIIWKTQYGYFSYLDDDLINSYGQLGNATISNQTLNSYKLFYKMNKLTKIYRNLTVKIGSRFAGETKSEFYVTDKNRLVVTNMRQILAGPFVCISLNEFGIKTYEYDIHIRVGVGEYFIYSLFVSLISMIIPSIIGLIVCCYCEYQVDKNYPMTPPCYPTPMVDTPPNFDFNEWMANAASYFPNLNIHETLEQVSKRLRKGMEKASVTVKSLGVTSTAYFYSMYEQSTQRWTDMKSYVPTLNVPSINLPHVKYPPVGQLANRMRMGMGNMFIHFREFCGTSDLQHTASIVDIDIDTSASHAVGNAYIMDQFSSVKSNLPPHHHANKMNKNYYRFLQMIKEDSFLKKFNINKSNGYNVDIDYGNCNVNKSECIQIDENQPQTSASASAATSSSSSSSASSSSSSSNAQLYTTLPKLFLNLPEINSPRNNSDDDDDDDDDDEDYQNKTKQQLNSPFKNNNDEDENGAERVSKLKPSLLNSPVNTTSSQETTTSPSTKCETIKETE